MIPHARAGRFVASREQNEAFPDYPEEEEGGSAIIFDPPPPKADGDGDGDGGDPKGKTGDSKKGDKKGDTGKKGGDKKADAGKKGKKEEEVDDRPAELPPSAFVLKMQVPPGVDPPLRSLNLQASRLA